MKQQVDTLAEHFDIQEPEPELTGVLQELRRGRKIQAIKAYRQATGTDLITAKSAVEDLARSHGI
jgi:ribosomal protein L7/L12